MSEIIVIEQLQIKPTIELILSFSYFLLDFGIYKFYALEKAGNQKDINVVLIHQYNDKSR